MQSLCRPFLFCFEEGLIFYFIYFSLTEVWLSVISMPSSKSVFVKLAPGWGETWGKGWGRVSGSSLVFQRTEAGGSWPWILPLWLWILWPRLLWPRLQACRSWQQPLACGKKVLHVFFCARNGWCCCSERDRCRVLCMEVLGSFHSFIYSGAVKRKMTIEISEKNKCIQYIYISTTWITLQWKQHKEETFCLVQKVTYFPHLPHHTQR